MPGCELITFGKGMFYIPMCLNALRASGIAVTSKFRNGARSAGYQFRCSTDLIPKGKHQRLFTQAGDEPSPRKRPCLGASKPDRVVRQFLEVAVRDFPLIASAVGGAKTEPSNFVEPRVSHGQVLAQLSVAPSIAQTTVIIRMLP